MAWAVAVPTCDRTVPVELGTLLIHSQVLSTHTLTVSQLAYQVGYELHLFMSPELFQKHEESVFIQDKPTYSILRLKLFRKYPIDKGCQRLLSIQVCLTVHSECAASRNKLTYPRTI